MKLSDATIRDQAVSNSLNLVVLKELDADTLVKVDACLRSGGIVSFATETVYALACDAKNDVAISRLYEIKNRDANKPIAIWLKDIVAAKEVFFLNSIEEKIVNTLMPGPITLVAQKRSNFLTSHLLNSASNFLGLRIPNHKFCLDLLKKFNGVIAATSCNLSGDLPALNASQVIKNLGNKIDLLVDGGSCPSSLPSTVLRVLSNGNLEIIRQGSMASQDIMGLIK